RQVLRKLDNPHVHCEAVRRLAADPRLVGLVESAIGEGISVYFSQIFFKPPEGGGPKPAHQDNFYFGPNDRDGIVTAWVALDDATVENGCLYFGEGSNHGPVFEHVAPSDEPFNLQLTAATLAAQRMAPAPVPCGGVSFHHGNTVHQSGPNLSRRWRRACALHYVGKNTFFANPALPYDHSLVVRIT
ncbi:MAG TPA: phytanoyl-CoA dioxygenase family protein, partial [Candidatus Sulfotelmatobacter sp.]|nr:phytanoyl-CoA dioxygenase family protein [Candidatus Sulfotelmatobacter sp.]